MSRACAQLAEEFCAWSTRDLSSVELDYLYLDGTSFRYHPSAQAEVKAAYWAIFDDITTTAGQAAVDEAARRAGIFIARYGQV